MNYDFKNIKDDGKFDKEETIVFGFSPYMHDNREFNKDTTTVALHGVLLYLYKNHGEGILRLETLPEPKEVNI